MPAFVFAGQGSQTPGMGMRLFDLFPDHVRAADDVLGYSIRQSCAEGDLRRTELAQPAIYVVNVLTYLAFQQVSPTRPSYLLGHSLGEYCALHLAGVFDFATGLGLVARRAAVMATARDGAMAAVVGVAPEVVACAVDDWSGGGLWIANYNSPQQTVISGHTDSVVAAREHFLAYGATGYIRLPVGGAFHSPLMDAAGHEFAAALSGAALRPPRASVVANATAEFYTAANTEQLLLQQISAPVRWQDSIELILTRGESHIVEIGARKVLTPLVDQIAAANRAIQCDRTDGPVGTLTDAVSSSPIR